MKSNPCKRCGSIWHTAFACPVKPNKPIKANKRISRFGPVTKKWIETRHQWIQANANATNTWNCYICGVVLTLETLTLDHIKSRSRHPELRFDLDNLAPCCWSCNTRKGSRDIDELYTASS